MLMFVVINKVFEFCNIYEFMNWLDIYFLKLNLCKYFINKMKFLILCNEMLFFL